MKWSNIDRFNQIIENRDCIDSGFVVEWDQSVINDIKNIMNNKQNKKNRFTGLTPSNFNFKYSINELIWNNI